MSLEGQTILVEVTCLRCGVAFTRWMTTWIDGRPTSSPRYCSLRCRRSYRRRKNRTPQTPQTQESPT
jgi:hypothetical protein